LTSGGLGTRRRSDHLLLDGKEEVTSSRLAAFPESEAARNKRETLQIEYPMFNL
jgi:hypothetical protein